MIVQGDCVALMAELAPGSVDAIVTDPPYGLGFMGREWDDLPPGIPWAKQCLRVLKPGGHLLAFGGTRTYHRLACAIEDAGFEIRDCLAYMYGSGFPKSLNLDRMRGVTFCGCGDDQGPPREPSPEHDVRSVPSADLPASLDAQDQRGEVLLEGMPESSTSARGMQRATATEGRSELGMEGRSNVLAEGGQLPADQVHPGAGVGAADGSEGRLRDGTSATDGGADRALANANGSGASPRPRSAEQRAVELGAVANESGSQAGGAWPTCGECGLPRVLRGLGTALKPAHEPIVLARKPLAGTVAANVLEHGTGALNVNGCRIAGELEEGRTRHGGGIEGNGSSYELPDSNGAMPAGRWPANVLLDEEAAGMLDEQSGEGRARGNISPTASGVGMFYKSPAEQPVDPGDTGGASRFFYVAKASSAERNAGLEGFEEQERRSDYGTVGNAVPHMPEGYVYEGKRRNVHPTVKPIELMRWLVRLITPPGGVVLDPFTGSGTTGCAAALEGFDFIGFEREAEYVAIAEARIRWWSQHPDGLEIVKSLEAERERQKIRDTGQLGLLS
jgi:DNA modification methylase